MTAPWWATLGPAEATADCGGRPHRLHWDAGRLTAVDHPDAESELVLATLGGDQPACIRLLRAWGEHCDDLEVLMLGPRSAADTLPDPKATTEAPLSWGSLWSRTQRSFAMNVQARPGSAVAAVQSTRHRVVHAVPTAGPRGPGALLPGRGQGPDGKLARQLDLFALFALGPAFQFRLCATVAATWAERDPGTARPALTAALAGRLAPPIAAWRRVSPGTVQVSLAPEPAALAWDADRWQAGMRWVATVWGAGLALVGRHLIVDVTQAEYPRATVLALAEPAGEPTALTVRCAGPPGAPRWRRV
jgi:hypothetical protein